MVCISAGPDGPATVFFAGKLGSLLPAAAVLLVAAAAVVIFKKKK